MSSASILPDWLLAIASLLGITGGGGALGYVRTVKQTADDAQDTADENERRLVGDPEDPNAEGVLDIAFETREKVNDLEARMEAEHREVMAKLEDIQDGRYEDDE